jgi:arylsulfatase A-like enzyme
VTWRPGPIAIVRAANALLCLVLSTYCLIAYSPFAYDQFIKPNTLPAIADFVAVSPWLFLVALLTTVLTLMPQLKSVNTRALTWPYVSAATAASVLMFALRPLDRAGHPSIALAAGLLALVFPVWLAAIDHRIWPALPIRPADIGRALTVCLIAGVAVWGIYATAAPMRLHQAVGVDLRFAKLALAAAYSLVFHLLAFTALFLVVASAIRLPSRAAGAGIATYWLLILCLAAFWTVVVALLVCRSIAFAGWDAWAWSLALGIAVAATWSDLARLRSQSTGAGKSDEIDPVDPLDLFSAPIAGIGARRAPRLVILGLPFAAYGLVELVRHLDWNFLLQKLGVLGVWMVAFACACAMVRRPWRWKPQSRALVPLLVLGLYHGAAAFDVRSELDRYAAVDPSFRLIRDTQIGQSSATAEYYRVLRANTLLPAGAIHSADVDFVRPLVTMDGRRPNIFMIVVDSMRRDYVSAYDSQVTFTPQIGRLAADSFVFRRAFTRYSGTGLAVPSLWAGGMVPHALEQPDFARRNTLAKLLEANSYRRIMDIDHVIEPLLPRDAELEELDRGKRTTEFDLCITLNELEHHVRQRADRPVFFYTLPQNVHIAIATRRPVPPGEGYPARFYDRIASSVRRVDACLGGFLDFLRREQLYDDSIIIVTSDHGDSLGEEGRWGHAYFMYPEVMNIPLIIHLPSWLRARVRTDLDAVAFSTDIAPTLYTLLGYQPNDLGPLFGRPLFIARDDRSSLRRRNGFLLASSYGAVYGMLAQNGRRLHVVDAVDGREFAFDLSGAPQPTTVTPATSAANRRMIAEQIAALASLYRSEP